MKKTDYFQGHIEARHFLFALGKLNCFPNYFPLFKCTEAFIQNKLSCCKTFFFFIFIHFDGICVFRGGSNTIAVQNLFEYLICTDAGSNGEGPHASVKFSITFLFYLSLTSF